MIGLLLLAIATVPFIDIYILVQIAGMIGFWQTLALILLTGAVGLEIVRREGIYVLVKMQRSVTAGEASRNALEIGFLVLAGLLLILPGIVTDVAGFLLVFRPVRERLAAKYSGEGFNAEVRTFGI
ncbi:FxsA family protein [Candidatus Nanosalina sp. VS9-1]|uniref:FxsA family protein n=1 Tax=Candidatus Nanosalina sp. VS9-1 TaxID=3388566 RepID=UPI0039E0F931